MMKRNRMVKVWAIAAVLIMMFFIRFSAEAASYPYLTMVSQYSSMTFRKGEKVDFTFRAYTGGRSSCRYSLVLYQDSVTGSKVAEAEGEYSITTDCTIGWNTAEYNPGKYVLKVSSEYYENYRWHSTYDGEQIYDITLTGEYASGKCGPSLTWKLTDDHVLTISGSGNMSNYSMGDAPWNEITLKNIWDVEDLIEKIVIGNGVTSIGNNAFYDCDSLREISLPATLKMIGESAFYNSSLEKIEMPDSVTAINERSFNGCSNLYSVKLSSKLKAIPSWAFNDCTMLDSIVIPEGVTIIDYAAFDGCLALEKITLPITLKTIGSSAFDDCSSLSTVIFNGSSQQWSTIEIKSTNNESLLSASVKYMNTYGKWVKTSAGWKYQISENGAVAKNTWKKIDGAWYYFDASGVMLNKWQKISGYWYYLSGGKMTTGWKKISGGWYYFGNDGRMVNGWKKISGNWYYFSGGKMVTGWKKINGGWYYFSGGKMVTGSKVIDGKTYKFSSSGKMIK